MGVTGDWLFLQVMAAPWNKVVCCARMPEVGGVYPKEVASNPARTVLWTVLVPRISLGFTMRARDHSKSDRGELMISPNRTS